MLFYLTGIVIFLYLLSLIILGSSKPDQQWAIASEESLKLSIIIPFRNESERLPSLFDSLEKQEFYRDDFEVILINDHSLDSGPYLVEEWKEKSSLNIKILNLKVHEGKKAAVVQGIKSANGKRIVCTDADCTFGARWLSTFNNTFNQTKASMIIAPVVLKGGDTFLEAIQKLENAILMRITEGATYLNKAFLANAANMAFPATVFQEDFLNAGNSVSGDDIFLLHALKKLPQSKIIFNQHQEAVVFTAPKTTLISFLQQRLRWASKSRYYRDPHILLFGSLVFAVNLLALYLVIWSFCHPGYWPLAAGFFALKIGADGWLLSRAQRYLQLKDQLLWFLLFSIFYPIYSIGIALLSLLFKPHWKGRRV